MLGGGHLGSSVRTVATVFANPDIRRLQLSWAAISLSLWSFAIALGVYAFNVSGPALVGVAALVRLAPGALASPVAGVLGDRHSRRLLLIVSSVTSAAALAAATVAAALDAPPAVVLAMAGVFTVGSCLYAPAEAALLPVLARTPQEVSAANVTHSMLDNLGFLAGGILTGVALAVSGPEVVFGFAAAVAAGAAALLARITPDRRPEYASESAEGAFEETLLGLRELRREPEMRLAVTGMTLLLFVEGAADVLAVVVPLDLLGLGDGSVGLLNVGWAVGALAGGAVLAVMLERGNLAAGLLLGGLLLGGSMALPAAWAVAVVACIAWLGIGFGYTFVEVAAITMLQRLGSDEALARVFGALQTLRYLAMSAGSIAVPVLAELMGVRGALVVIAAVMPAFALLSWQALRRLDAGAPLDERGYALLREDPIFAPLPMATVERLGHSLNPVEAAAGETVITEGDHGDHFYLIDEGQVEVLEGDVFRCHQGPGASFGEIALLRDVPRTATVRAVKTTRLLALGRESFLRAVTGQRRSREAAVSVMGERLSGSSAEHLRGAPMPHEEA